MLQIFKTKNDFPKRLIYPVFNGQILSTIFQAVLVSTAILLHFLMRSFLLSAGVLHRLLMLMEMATVSQLLVVRVLKVVVST